MSKPIPIASDPHTTPPTVPIQPSQSPTSSLSISPQTPFYPPSGLASPPLPGLAGLSTTAPPSGGFFKWASPFSKSPSVPNDLTGRDVRDELTPRPGPGQGMEKPEEDHDSFEFGDWNDIRSRGWNNNRRALSMSMPRGQSGISAMLAASGGQTMGQGTGASNQGILSGGVMADKAAKGQGVLRRISFSNTLTRAPFVSPGPLSPPLQAPPPAAVQAGGNNVPAPQQPSLGADLQRAKTIGGPPSGERGRRGSEQRKRGVSPMGERLLRDHGHF